MTSLAEFIDTLDVEPSHPWAWANYRPIIEGAIQHFGCRAVLEMGGGRMPLFKPDEIIRLDLNYVINDIDQSELDRIDPSYHGVSSVMCADITRFPQDRKFDLIVSKMVYEHVKDNRRNLTNQLGMLNDGGIIIHFHPVLFSFPLFINYVSPSSLSRKLMDVLYGRSALKFPAYYNMCYATKSTEEKLSGLGFSEVCFIPIWGHNYYRKIRPLHRLQVAGGRSLAKMDARLFATYCFTIARK